DNCSNFSNEIGTIQLALDELESEGINQTQIFKDQFIIMDGDQYQAIRIIYKILSHATSSITIVDPYLDENIFDYIESLDNKISLYLLTEKYKSIFQALYEAFKKQRTNIEAKITGRYHDRFIIIDEVDVWHLGTSINNAGNKVFMINKIKDESVRIQFIVDLKAEWSKSKPL
ncbi:MAG: hypothetical protein ACREOP_03620, partial [Thermodesulfobacteriota bacterium]